MKFLLWQGPHVAKSLYHLNLLENLNSVVYKKAVYISKRVF